MASTASWHEPGRLALAIESRLDCFILEAHVTLLLSALAPVCFCVSYKNEKRQAIAAFAKHLHHSEKANQTASLEASKCHVLHKDGSSGWSHNFCLHSALLSLQLSCHSSVEQCAIHSLSLSVACHMTSKETEGQRSVQSPLAEVAAAELWTARAFQHNSKSWRAVRIQLCASKGCI